MQNESIIDYMSEQIEKTNVMCSKSVRAKKQSAKNCNARLFSDRLVNTKQSSAMESRRKRFEQLVSTCVNPLYTQAMRLTQNAQDAQDLVQDTFERALKSFETFQPDTNFAAWINRIERNLYFNQYAKAKRSPKRANDETGDYNDWDIYEASNHCAKGMLSAEQEYLEGFAPQEIIAALSKLPPERRKVFIEAAIRGKSYKQIAQEEGVKIGTVMSRLNRARMQLKRELSDYSSE